MKTTSNGRRPPMEDDLKLLKVEYLSNRLLDHAQILNLDLGNKSKMKTTSNGRRHQNIKNGISQQSLIGCFSNFKLKLRLLKTKFTNP